MNDYDFNRTIEEMSDAELENAESLRRLAEKKKRNRIIVTIVSAIVAAVFLLLTLYIVVLMLFRLKTVEISGNSRYTYEEIYEASGVSEGMNLSRINPSKIKEAIINEYPYVKNAEVKISLPDKISITITEDSAKWYGKVWGLWFVFSGDLRVMEQIASPEDRLSYGDKLKWIKLPETDYVVAGEKVVFNKTTAFDYTLSFLNELSEQSIFDNLEFIDVSDRYHIRLYMNQHKYKLILGDSKSLKAKLRLIERIIEECKISGDIKDTSIVSFDAESVSPVIMLVENELYTYDD